MIGQVFLAASDRDALAHLDDGPFVGGLPDAVAVGELTPLEFDALQSVLTGAPFADVLESADGGPVGARSDAGPWVSRIRGRLTHALAVVADDRVAPTAARWAGREEVTDVDVDTLAAVLGPLADLARTADRRRGHLYLWNRL